jgi:AcrR family transcriptional regulator
MSTTLDTDSRRNTILLAALAVFARYGFKRVAMADIAEEAGVSRPALYLAFPNKAAIFEALAHSMAKKVVADAQAAWVGDVTFGEGLAASAIALHLDGWRLIKGSPHGGELVSANSALVGDISATIDAGFTALVKRHLAQTRRPDFDAKIIVSALSGIKDKANSETDLKENITAFSKLVAAGLGL